MSLLDKIKSVLGMEGTESESTGGNTRSTDESGVTVERETETKTDTDADTETNTDTDIDDTQTDVDEMEERKGEAAEDEEGVEADEGEGNEEGVDEGEGNEEGVEENEAPEDEVEDSPEVSGTMVDTDAGVETGEIAGQANTQTGPADEPGEATGPTSTDGPGPVTGQSEEVPETETGDVEGGVEIEDPSTEEADHDTAESDSDSEPVDIIKGVGTTYAERLGEEGIESVDDLASADPETLAEETDISPKRIERWIGRAQHR